VDKDGKQVAVAGYNKIVRRFEIASVTSWRSMISPSTMASESGSEIP
jgi:hypothetical protein